MQSEARRADSPKHLHRYAVLTALATYLLIVVGGLVDGARLGQALPHGHRWAAAFVALLTLGLAVALTRAHGRAASLPKLGWLALALVAAQAALGGVGAWLKLPAAVAAVHTGASLVCFLTVFYLAAQTSSGADSRVTLAPSARRLALVAAIAVLVQALLGALVRTSAGPLAPQFQLVHRLGATLVAVLVFASGIRTYRAAAGAGWLRWLAIATPVLLAAQISLGVRSVQQVLDLSLVQAHLAVGAALLAASWATYLLSAPSVATPAPALAAQARAFAQLAKPRITVMVVVTFAGGLWLAPGAVEPWRRVVALLGTILIVAAANALNMYLERDSDGLMARTSKRPLPQGRLSPDAAVGFGALLACLSLPLLLLGGNALTLALGVLAFASYVWAYTPLKRVSSVALYVGAVPGAMPPLMGWTTATGHMDAAGLALFAIMFVWQVPHFLAIALYRSEEYERAGIRVLPVTQGIPATRWQIVWSTVVLVAVSLSPVYFGAAGRIYLVAAVVLGGAFLWSACGAFGSKPVRPWARSVFLVSLLYLTGLFASLAVDHWLR